MLWTRRSILTTLECGERENGEKQREREGGRESDKTEGGGVGEGGEWRRRGGRPWTRRREALDVWHF